MAILSAVKRSPGKSRLLPKRATLGHMTTRITYGGETYTVKEDVQDVWSKIEIAKGGKSSSQHHAVFKLEDGRSVWLLITDGIPVALTTPKEVPQIDALGISN